MRTILGFDSWTEGSQHYERLVKPLRDAGFEIKLIHFGSYGHDPGRPKGEQIGALKVLDISYFKGRGIRDILLQENPCAVIFLSTHSFLHRAVNRYCKELGIPTLHLYHGLITVQAVETGQPDRYRFAAQAALSIRRAAKNVKVIFPIYVKALLETAANWRDWLFFARDILYKVVGKYTKLASIDASTTMGAVYARSDVAHASSTYRIPIHRIAVVGNPDFVKFGLQEENLCSCLRTSKTGSKVIYIDHGGSTSGFTFTSESDFLEFLQRMNDHIATIGLTLLVKLHPAQCKTNIVDSLVRSGVALSTDSSFLDDLMDARAVITGPSTAAVIPASLGIPVLLAQHDQFAGQQYGVVFRDYPRAYPLRNLGELRNLLEQDFCPHESLMKAWCDRYISPLPAEDMPQRVVSVVLKMLRDHRGVSEPKISILDH